LRDREGSPSACFRPEENPEAAQASHKLREEDVVQVTGVVSKRLEGTVNDKIATGAIEIVAKELTIVNKADVLPFQLDKELSNEDLRMKYRYLDLRRAAHEPQHPPAQRDHLRRPPYLDESGFSKSRPRSCPTRRPRARATSWCRRASTPAASTPCPRHRSNTSS
jgi:aspartyl-tRNA synthetase